MWEGLCFGYWLDIVAADNGCIGTSPNNSFIDHKVFHFVFSIKGLLR